MPDYDPYNGCTWEGYLFIYPADQYNSCNTTYTTAFPAVGSTVYDTVKYGYWKFFSIDIPDGVRSIAAMTSSATDIDLYVGQAGYYPTLTNYSCASTSSSGDETCQIDYPAPGPWGFGVYGYADATSSFSIVITQTGAPDALTGMATNSTATTALLNGTVSANGAPTTTAFDYGQSSLYGQSVTAQSASGSSPQNVSAAITGLTCATQYHFRVRASNAGGTAYGADSTFWTGNCPVTFTDDPIIVGATPVKAIHVTELRMAINSLRASVGLAPYSFSATISGGMVISVGHIIELRAALDDTRASIGLPKLQYSNAIVSGALIHAVDIMEIRNALR